MTRLTSRELGKIPETLYEFDRGLTVSTGCTLQQLACHSYGITEKNLQSAAPENPVAVIPITAGRGIITGFTESIQAIATYLGFPALITSGTDVNGLAEALRKHSRILVLADDFSYIAVNVKTLHVADNVYCTAKGFVTGLELMAGKLAGREVLLVGCGNIGRSACQLLLERCAKVTVHDIIPKYSLHLSQKMSKNGYSFVEVEENLDAALNRHELIFDACPAPGIIDVNFITKNTYVSAPGVPSGVTPSAQKLLAGRYLHDPLIIGTALMLVEAALA